MIGWMPAGRTRNDQDFWLGQLDRCCAPTEYWKPRKRCGFYVYKTLPGSKIFFS